MIAIMAMSANAQVTWNTRAGIGLSSGHRGDNDGVVTWFGQANIPFGSNRLWTFSPTIQVAPTFNDNPHIGLPLLVGHKFLLGNHSLFIPKIGPFIGFDLNDDEPFMFGPAVELAFEIKHFVIAINGVYSLIKNEYESDYSYYFNGSYHYSYYYPDYNPFNATISFGYKF